MSDRDGRHQRIMLLLQQQRYALAEQELRLVLAEQPDSDWPHAMLALCLVNLEKYQEANGEAEAAVGLAPDNAFAHYVHSLVLAKANCLPEAERAIRAALSLEHYSATYFAQLGFVLLQRKQWQQALEAAEQGLEVDPTDDDCGNVRSVALIKLGRRTEASASLKSALARDPDDAYTHANLGWSLIEQGKYTDAMTHFREALRLEPNMEHARVGIITALKAQNILYRPLLWYFLWAQKLTDKYAWGLMIGSYLVIRFLDDFANKNPAWWKVILPVIIVYVIFAVSSWLGNPLFNLVLMTNRFGRMALSSEEKKTSLLVAGSLLVALALLIAAYWDSMFLICSLGALLASLPLSKVYSAEVGWPRWSILGMGLLVLFMATFPVGLIYTSSFLPTWSLPPLINLARLCVESLMYVALGSQILSQYIAIRQPRRITF